MKKLQKKEKINKDNIKNIIIIIFPALYFGINEKPTEMGLMIVASSLTIAFMNIDKIQRFKGAGFEAEMRDIVNEAYATIDTLKKLSKPLIISSVDNLSLGAKETDRDKLIEDIEMIIDGLELKDKDIYLSLKAFYYYEVWNAFNKFIEQSKSEIIVNKIEELQNQINNKKNTFPSKEIILSIIEKEINKLSPQLKEMLLYYDEKKIKYEKIPNVGKIIQPKYMRKI